MIRLAGRVLCGVRRWRSCLRKLDDAMRLIQERVHFCARLPNLVLNQVLLGYFGPGHKRQLANLAHRVVKTLET